MKDKPFIYLLNNMDKLDIDEAMVPVFKELLEKMEIYFEENNLINSIDYVDFFDKYLIADSQDKIKFRLKINEDIYNSSPSCYDPKIKTLTVNDYELDMHKLCHEFIHLLVWRTIDDNSKEKALIQNSETFFDEGATENLARNITGFKPREDQNIYNENIDFVNFLESMFTKEEFNKYFLSGKSLFKKYFGEELKNYPIYLSYLKNPSLTDYLYEHNPQLNPKNQENLFLEIERGMENYILENYKYKCNTIQDLIDNVKMCSKRPLIDKYDIYHNISSLYLRMINKTIENINCSEPFTLKMDIDKILKKIMESYDELYINDNEDFAKIILKGKDERDEYELFVNQKCQVIKSDLYAHPAGTPTFRRFIVYENSNEEERNKYECDLMEISKIDYSIRRKELNNAIDMLFDELFSISDIVTNNIINSILKEYFNENLESINSEKLVGIKQQLQNVLDEHLYLKIEYYLDNYIVNKQI